MYSQDEIDHALSLSGDGLNLSQVARATGIARATVRKWSRGDLPRQGLARQRASCLRCHPEGVVLRRASESAYAYLLGLYLGDGSIAKHPRAFRLAVSLDRGYPVIVAECEAAISIVMPRNRVLVVHRGNGQVDDVTAYSKHWPCLFPQHGPGKKHHRRIALEAWQSEICDRFPHRLLRGLIHSDGYRGMNRIRHPKKTYAYPRYQFSNRSDDIRGSSATTATGSRSSGDR